MRGIQKIPRDQEPRKSRVQAAGDEDADGERQRRSAVTTAAAAAPARDDGKESALPPPPPPLTPPPSDSEVSASESDPV